MNIQRAIRSYIELNCGVAVREVSVSVNALEGDEANRHGRGRKGAAEPAAPVFQSAPAPVEAPAQSENVEPAPIQLHLDPIMDAPVQEDTEEPEEQE